MHLHKTLAISATFDGMTTRQKILKAVYPLWMRFTNLIGSKSASYKNKTLARPPVPFHALSVELNNGSQLSFAGLKGRKVLIVNTASNCGYTHQYEALQELHEQFADRLTVIGFPANDFKEQEKGDDAAIADFCKLNYGVSFLLAKKSSVIGAQQNKVFKWLSHSNENGWNDKAPTWNFSKYLVSEEGVLLQYFDPGISPKDESVISLIR